VLISIQHALASNGLIVSRRWRQAHAASIGRQGDGKLLPLGRLCMSPCDAWVVRLPANQCDALVIMVLTLPVCWRRDPREYRQ